MKLTSILSPDRVIIGLKSNSKKQLLQDMVKHCTAGLEGFDLRKTLDSLMERERLGCTSIGGGIAIPHTRCDFPKSTKAAEHPLTCLALLHEAIDYHAHDNLHVDIVFMLLAPKNTGGEHLTALALASRVLRDQATAERLRGCTSVDAILSVLDADISSASNAA